jgi:hypothetical protein
VGKVYKESSEKQARVLRAPLVKKTRDNSKVPIVPRGMVDQKRIKDAVERVKRTLQPDVIRIMYSFAVDWTGEQSLFFRIILSDKASSPQRLRETAQRITRKIRQEIKADESGLLTYFNFRSQSEQAKLKEPAWEP